jgi:Cellulose biosynthesis protein BcsS
VSALNLFGAAAAAATMILCATAVRAEGNTPDNPSFLLFAGTDLWDDGAFVHGGLLWSPGGVDADGFTLKTLLSGGLYDYPSDSLHVTVEGTLFSAAALPGWRITANGVSLALYAGPVVQDYRLTPDDPGSRLRGTYAGAQLAGDLWYQPTPASMVALSGFVASIGPTGSVRAAVGGRFGEPFFVGPETQGIWCIDYEQFRFGVHVTALRIDATEWSAAGGIALDSFGRAGPYVRLGFFTRY